MSGGVAPSAIAVAPRACGDAPLCADALAQLPRSWRPRRLGLTERMFAYYARRVFRFVLRDTDMNDLGSVSFPTTAWGPGDVFTAGDGRKLRILDMLNFAGAGRGRLAARRRLGR